MPLPSGWRASIKNTFSLKEVCHEIYQNSFHTVRAATKLGKASKQRLKTCKEGINNAAMAGMDKLGIAIALFENLLG